MAGFRMMLVLDPVNLCHVDLLSGGSGWHAAKTVSLFWVDLRQADYIKGSLFFYLAWFKNGLWVKWSQNYSNFPSLTSSHQVDYVKATEYNTMWVGEPVYINIEWFPTLVTTATQIMSRHWNRLSFCVKRLKQDLEAVGRYFRLWLQFMFSSNHVSPAGVSKGPLLRLNPS